jgi:hypothetical protein
MELIPGGIIQAFLSGAALLRLLQNKCTIRGPGRERCSTMDLPRFRFHMGWHNNFQPRTSLLPKIMISSLLSNTNFFSQCPLSLLLLLAFAGVEVQRQDNQKFCGIARRLLAGK